MARSVVVAAGLLCGAVTFADDPPPPGQRVFTCSHSFHNHVPSILNELAHAAGIKDHVQVGLSSIGGSSVMKHWETPEDKFKVKPALREGRVDVLTLSPIWLPDEGIEKFARLAVEHNPDIRVTVQAFWLPNDEYEPRWPLDMRKVVDHDAADLDALRAAHEAYFADIDGMVNALNAELGSPVLRVVPVGQAVLALREKIVAGEAPGITKQSELFIDSWGHITAPVWALNTYCHYAVIYGRSPVGLPMPSMPPIIAKVERPEWRNDELNRLLQELAWEAVVNHPLSGVKPSPAE